MATAERTQIDPAQIRPNPHNPRVYFNEEQLDLLRTSIQEIGILVPLIAYEDPEKPESYILMDGERRWRVALDLGLETVPVNLIGPPTDLENVLRMFNIHAVREDWPLISLAYALRDVILMSGEDRESRLAEMTGLTRSAVRRSKRLLSLPPEELERIKSEAHLDREKQIHREDLYLEIEAAESVLRRRMPEVAKSYPRERIIRQFARKREVGRLRAVTEFREVGKVIQAVDDGLVEREVAVDALKRLVRNVKLNPSDIAEELAPEGFEQRILLRRAELLSEGLAGITRRRRLSPAFREALRELRREIDRLLGQG
jgi:ParB family transcriptional regulator, chromosome partitioning protein